MHIRAVSDWQHDHIFEQDKPRPGEKRTLIVVALTAVAMVVELTAGLAFGSMALLADGLHMASHAAALGIAVAAYVYTRRQAHNRNWTFGTGKVNALGGFASALLLVLFAALMAWESTVRMFEPVAIAFNEAILVAVAGLAVNAACMVILGRGGHHHHHHHHGEAHGHADHNLRGAYLHVLADALTSLLAIFALLSGKYFGLTWMDPLMGILGAVLVARWAWALLRDTSGVLLDRQAPRETCAKVTQAIEDGGEDRVADLHVWSIGPNIYAMACAVITHEPKAPRHYKRLIPRDLGIVHSTIEVHRCQG